MATNLLENGTPIHVLQELIGHSDLTTLNRYKAKIEPKKAQYRNYVIKGCVKV